MPTTITLTVISEILQKTTPTTNSQTNISNENNNNNIANSYFGNIAQNNTI
jgi:hypothetical protein